MHTQQEAARQQATRRAPCCGLHLARLCHCLLELQPQLLRHCSVLAALCRQGRLECSHHVAGLVLQCRAATMQRVAHTTRVEQAHVATTAGAFTQLVAEQRRCGSAWVGWQGDACRSEEEEKCGPCSSWSRPATTVLATAAHLQACRERCLLLNPVDFSNHHFEL